MSAEKAEESTEEERRMVAIAVRPCAGVDAEALFAKIKAEITSQVRLLDSRSTWIELVLYYYVLSSFRGILSNDVLPATQKIAGLVSRAIFA